MPVSVEELYGDLWRQPRPGFEQRLSTSLAPRGFGLMMEVFGDTGAGPEHTVLDIGCRDADLSIDLSSSCV